MTDAPPILNIRGERVGLGPLRADLIDLSLEWLNDFDVTRTLAVGNRPFTREAQSAWFSRASVGEDRIFVIYELSTMRPIGTTGLHQIDPHHRTAEYGILIGERDAWRKGYGTETTRLMVQYAFGALNLHSVYLRVYENNPAGLKAYERAGFRVIGRRRQSVFVDGKPIDVIYMDCVSGDV